MKSYLVTGVNPVKGVRPGQTLIADLDEQTEARLIRVRALSPVPQDAPEPEGAASDQLPDEPDSEASSQEHTHG